MQILYKNVFPWKTQEWHLHFLEISEDIAEDQYDWPLQHYHVERVLFGHIN